MFLEPKLNSIRRLEKYILEFEKEEIVKNKILFYGSSSFTRWKPERWENPRLEDEIRMRDGSQACVNHGFGSSTAEELLYYYDRAVRPWEPRALVLLCFGNDNSAGYSAKEILALETRVLEWARTDFPGVRLYYCNVRPTLKDQTATKARRNQEIEYNELVKHYCGTHPDTVQVDQWNFPGFYTEGGAGDPDKLRPEIFVEDKVHLNAEGYRIYRELFLDVLSDIL